MSIAEGHTGTVSASDIERIEITRRPDNSMAMRVAYRLAGFAGSEVRIAALPVQPGDAASLALFEEPARTAAMDDIGADSQRAEHDMLDVSTYPSVTDALAALSGNKGALYFPYGTHDISGVDWTGAKCDLIGDGPGTILSGDLDMTGFENGTVGVGSMSRFTVNGDITVPQSLIGAAWRDIIVAGNIALTDMTLCRFDNIMMIRTVQAATCYLELIGATNGCTFTHIGFWDGTAAELTESMCKIYGDAGGEPTRNRLIGWWVQSTELGADHAVLDVWGNGNVIEQIAMFDPRLPDTATGEACVVRLNAVTIPASRNYGGNDVRFAPGTGGNTDEKIADYGIITDQPNNRIGGIRQYCGAADFTAPVLLKAGADDTVVEIGGSFGKGAQEPVTAHVVGASSVSGLCVLDMIRGDQVFGTDIRSFTDEDATPSVALHGHWKTANTAPTTITMFDDGYIGQKIWIHINDNQTTVDFTGTNLKGNGGVDWSPTDGDFIAATFNGTYWFCEVHAT